MIRRAVHAFTSCCVDYCNSLLYGATDSLICKIQSAKNVVAHLVSGARRCDRITCMLKPNSITLAGSELVRSWFELQFGLSSSLLAAIELARASRFAAKFHYAIWFEAGSELVRTR